jgi:hypothetical protein
VDLEPAAAAAECAGVGVGAAAAAVGCCVLLQRFFELLPQQGDFCQKALAYHQVLLEPGQACSSSTNNKHSSSSSGSNSSISAL